MRPITVKLRAAGLLARHLLPLPGEMHAHGIDLLNRLDGFCCAKDLKGYRHWRCGRPRGHAGRHRTNNYTWLRNQHAEYDPIPIESTQQVVAVPRATYSPTYIQRLRTMPWTNLWAKCKSAAADAEWNRA